MKQVKLIIFFLFSVNFIIHISGREKIVTENAEYLISYPTKKNWYQAGRECKALGYELISIETLNEEIDLLNAIHLSQNNLKNEVFWTSGSDLGSEGSFYWSINGVGFVYTNFKNGEPDNYGNNVNCVSLAGVDNFQWHDANCDDEKYFICKKYETLCNTTTIVNIN